MKILSSTVMSVAFGFTLFGSAMNASAVPLVSPASAVTVFSPEATVDQVRMMRRSDHQGGGFGGGGGDGIGFGIGLGILGGLLLDNAINGGNYSDGSCSQRFRSYDPRSETYLGNDGRRHHCS